MMYNTCMRSLSVFGFSIEQFELMVVSFVALAIIIFICIYSGVLNHRDLKHRKDIKDLSNKTRIYVVDVENDIVNYFNSDRLKERKTSSITVFYNLYDSKDREILINWIGNLLDKNSGASKFLEIKIYSRKERQYFPTILEVQKIDYKKQTIFLESHLLPKNLKQSKKDNKLVFSNVETLKKRILTSSGRGATYFFNFYDKNTKTSGISQLIYANVRDIILSYANENVLISEESDGRIILAHFNVKGKEEMLAFVHTIQNRINKFLLIKSFSDVSYSIGIIENSENFRDFSSLIKKVKAVSEHCKDVNEQIAFFSESSMLLTEEQSNQYRTDVQNIIYENKIDYLFQPIINVDKGKVVAYKASAVPVDSFFTDMESVKKYAVRTEDDKDLFSAITRNTISRFVQEKNEKSLKLFYPISFNELKYVSTTLSRADGVNEINIVLVLSEKDFSNLGDRYEDSEIIDLILSFKSKGYSVALEIDDDILTLKPSLYSVFDFFNLSVASHLEKKNAGTTLPTFQGLIEKLLHYNKPLIALDIDSWDIVELVYRLGVSRICSDAVALPSSNIMPIQKKTLNKILNLKS